MAAAAVQPNMPAERSKVWTCRIDAPTDEQRKILYERSYASELIQRLAVLPVPPRDGAASAVDCFVVLSQRKSASPQLCELLLRGDWQQARFDSQEWERLRRACEDAGGVVHDKTHQGAREPAPLQPLPEQQQQPKPRGIAPSVSGVQCMWDGVVGCWRAADGGVHVAPRRESKEAAAAEERAAQDALPEWKRLLQGIHAWRLRSAFSELTTATAHEEMKRQVAQRMRELEKLQRSCRISWRSEGLHAAALITLSSRVVTSCSHRCISIRSDSLMQAAFAIWRLASNTRSRDPTFQNLIRCDTITSRRISVAISLSILGSLRAC